MLSPVAALIGLSPSPVPVPTPTPTSVPTPTPTPAPPSSPLPSPTFPVKPADEALMESCTDGLICPLFNQMFDNAKWVPLVAGVADLFLILIIAFVIRAIVNRLIGKLTTRMGTGLMPERLRYRTATVFDGNPALLAERRRQRARTMDSLLKSIASIIILGTAVLTILGRLGIPLGPLLASASVIGVAVGFGAQNVIKDFLSGLFMILEDQFGVGDVIDVQHAQGTVEAVTLRITRLRDVNGAVWYVRNGEIIRVGNESQGWARAVFDVPVSYDSDVPRVREVLKQTAVKLWRDLEEGVVLEEPEVWGVEAISHEAVVIRVVVKTAPLKQWEVSRELRVRVKDALDREGISLAAAPS
ncbi:mechanosensitive ion channel family protein [Rhizohabitans arisaemae]|uniref:mechanosensitive ion channel family protein n=1 Tax=Rhizohabitans arisaemae TaxID=2720610 RepID=UPI0024B14ADD|nr:mechanosensitive ion channel family protein [Rhizohabitans arisaemae]